MKRHILRAIIVTFVSFLLGAGVYYLTVLETTLGFDRLFKLRGVHPPPKEVLIVAMDETSENRLKVGQDLTRWRSFHTRLVQTLQSQGAALIIFDLQFILAHPDQDPAFAGVIHKAGNVLLVDCVQKLRSGNKDFYGRDECSDSNKDLFVQQDGNLEASLSERLVAQRKIPPVPMLADAALDHAPFYLTNDAENSTIREAWTFFDALAEAPALPVVAWFYTLQQSGALPTLTQPKQPLSAWLTEQRRHCPIALDTTLISHLKQADLQRRIKDVICWDDSRYLNFYGPPKTFRMESYSDVYAGKVTDLQNKVVFVGKASRKYSPGKTDFFQTPFSDTRSGKMAGVEIMATQFANLLEDRFIEAPFPPALLFAIFGLIVAFLLSNFSGLSGILASLLFSGTYAGTALWLFSRYALWLPVAVPLLIQLPVSVLLSLLGLRWDLLEERKRILVFVRQVFPQWISFIPASPGQWYPNKSSVELTSEQDVRGLCIATDIEGYTDVAARYTAHQMWQLLSDYYLILGQSVHSHKGIIADITGDTMMAVWINLPEAVQRSAACLAALEIENAVERFNDSSSAGRLPTRIGIHEGDMTLGRLDAGEVSHYRAIGDTVNTASRIQGVNKFLGTQILASKAIVANLPNLICRPVGTFQLIGREEPVALIEIIGLETDVEVSKLVLYEKFAQGLLKFQRGQWQDAIVIFQSLLNTLGDDGPTHFYIDLALSFQTKPHMKWKGVVQLNEK
ncbi:MAG: adenylate/guanylate cyclase domain-containing protein [Methylococcales bacterium]